MKIGDQFLMVNPLTRTDDVIVCIYVDREDGRGEFQEFQDGKVFPASVTFRQKDIDKGGGAFNLRPIDAKHPAYIKGWKKNSLIKGMALLDHMFRAAEKAEESGKDPMSAFLKAVTKRA